MEIQNKSEEEEEVEVPSGSDFLYHSLPIRFVFFNHALISGFLLQWLMRWQIQAQLMLRGYR
jgi:hypothetical protein